MNATLSNLEKGNNSYKNMVARFDIAQGILWTYFDTRPRPCVTTDLLKEYAECPAPRDPGRQRRLESGTTARSGSSSLPRRRRASTASGGPRPVQAVH